MKVLVYTTISMDAVDGGALQNRPFLPGGEAFNVNPHRGKDQQCLEMEIYSTQNYIEFL